ncbi:MAG TPA: M28 family peptidase [Gemmatimonadales bacterium]|nr:M28 family peptidase [Gemmatimonadales bacterium]
MSRTTWRESVRGAALGVVFAACAASPPPRPFDGAQALRYAEIQLAFGPRIPGTPGHGAASQWLDSLLTARADTLIVQRWTHTTATGDSLPLQNFIARFNPAAQQRLLFLAHWDSRPRSDGPTAGDARGPVPGANDGASGVAVLLAVADALGDAPPAIGVDLLLVDGEDYGLFPDKVDVLIGSRYYAANQPPGPKPRYAVLLDMVGDRDLAIYQEGYSLIAAPDLVEYVWDTARDIGHGGIFLRSSKHTVEDDHVPLQQVGIRAINIIDFDYPYWHTVDDTIDKISAASLQVVGEVVLELIRKGER